MGNLQFERNLLFFSLASIIKGGLKMGKSFGLPEKWASALAYVFSFVTGIFFLVTEKESKKVRFHALQSIILGFAFVIINIALSIFAYIPILGIVFILALKVVKFAFIAGTVFLMYMAYKGTEFKVPIIGDAAWNQIYNK